MKKAVIILLVIALCLGITACGESGESEDSKKPEESETKASPSETPKKEYEVTFTKAITFVDSIGTTWVQTIIEITNTSQDPLFLSSSSYDLEDSTGKLISSRTLVSAYPDVIDPEEKGYIYEETTLDDPTEKELKVVPHLSVSKARVENIRYKVSDIVLSDDPYGGIKALGRIENITEEAGSMTYVVVVLLGKNDLPIGVLYTILTNEIAPGEKIGFEATSMAMPETVTMDSVGNSVVYAYPSQTQL